MLKKGKKDKLSCFNREKHKGLGGFNRLFKAITINYHFFVWKTILFSQTATLQEISQY